MKNFFTILGVVATILFVACSSDSDDKQIIINEVTFDKVTSPLQLKVGEVREINLSGGDENNFSVKSSSDEFVEASISQKKLRLVALKQGVTTLVVTSAQKSSKLEINVSNVLIENIEIQELGNFQPGTYKLLANVYPENATHKTLTWKSSDEAIVRINSKTGEIYIKPRYGASATITAEATDGSGVVAQGVINVVKLVRNITILQGNVQWAIGVNTQLTTDIEPSDATNQTLAWESDNPEVVKVDGQGRIQTLKEGRATITARSTDGSVVFHSVEIKVVLGINKIAIDQANGTETFEVKRGTKVPLSVSIWHEDELMEQGIQNTSKSGFGIVSWHIVHKPNNNTASFGRTDKHVFESYRTGQVRIKATYHDTLTDEYIDSKEITITIVE